MIVLKTGEMQVMDRQTIADGYPEILLMEAAGRGVAELTREKFLEKSCNETEREKSETRIAEFENISNKNNVINKFNNNYKSRTEILIFAGKGNNGGDGLVAARYFDMWHYQVHVILMGKAEELSGITATNYDLCLQRGINILEITDINYAQIEEYINKSSIIIDALLGTGLKGEIREPYAGVVELINQFQIPVIAVDIPTGIDGDNGCIHGQAVMANYTATMAFLKTGLCIYPGRSYCGEVKVIDIGMPEKTSINKVEYSHYLLHRKEAGELLPQRPVTGHKGTFGKIGVIGGSTGMAGASALTGISALKTGAGLVKLAVPETIQTTVAGYASELITRGLPANQGQLTTAAFPQIKELANQSNVFAVGPGLGRSETVTKIVSKIIKEIDIPVVLDADGINAVADAEDLSSLRARQTPLILTPHPGEMARLLHSDVSEIEDDRLGVVRKFVEEFKIYLVLKGASTVIGLPDGRIYINPTGNEGLATAGSGDVLTGIITGLLAQGVAPANAAILGPYLHGLAGDLAQAAVGSYSMSAVDIYQYISSAIKKIQAYQ